MGLITLSNGAGGTQKREEDTQDREIKFSVKTISMQKTAKDR